MVARSCADYIYVGIEPTIRVAFNQPMNRKAVEVVFTLVNTETNEEFGGRFEWLSEGMAKAGSSDYDYQPYDMTEGSEGPTCWCRDDDLHANRPLNFGASDRALVPGGSKGSRVAWVLPTSTVDLYHHPVPECGQHLSVRRRAGG